MKKKAKNLIKYMVDVMCKGLIKIKFGRILLDQLLYVSLEKTTRIEYKENEFIFSTPNSLCFWRVKTFSTKEPETLEWINSIPIGSNLWDIGANIGLYSIYASKIRDCNVWAFEPSVFNLELLSRNIYHNKLTDKICIMPLPLNDVDGSSYMHMTSTEWGGALSTFDKEYGWDGKQLNEIFKFKVFGLSMNSIAAKMRIPFPDYIKIDVDGIEHVILKGASDVLSSVKGILIEVNDAFSAQAVECEGILVKAGLTLTEKKHSEMFDDPNSLGGGQVWNQIWIRK